MLFVFLRIVILTGVRQNVNAVLIGFIHSKDFKSAYHRDICASIMTLLAVPKDLRGVRCPSTDRWIEKTWRTYPTEFC